MQRFFIALFLLLLVGGCATMQLTGPNGTVYNIHDDETLKVRIPVPEGWTEQFETAPSTHYIISSPSKKAMMIITIDPMATADDKLLKEIEMLKKRLGPNADMQKLAGTISGHRARGFRLSTEAAEMKLFAIDHDRGIYVLVTVLANNAEPQDREALQFIFEHLQIVEDE